MAQCGSVLGLRAAKGLSRWFWHGSEQIRVRIYLRRGNCKGLTMWLGSSVVRVLGSSSGRAMFFFLVCDMCLEYIIGRER